MIDFSSMCRWVMMDERERGVGTYCGWRTDSSVDNSSTSFLTDDEVGTC